MSSIKIAFFNWNTLTGKIIKSVTNGNFSHCGIITEEISDKIVTYEALNKGLTRCEYSRSLFENWKVNGTVQVIELSIATPTEDILNFCKENENNKYDWLAIFHIGLAWILGRHSLRFSDGAKRLICSEFCARGLFYWSKGVINAEVKLKKKFDEVTPQDIYNLLTNNL